MSRRRWSTTQASASLGGVLLVAVALFLASVFINAAPRPTTTGSVTTAAEPADPENPPAAPAAVADPFEAKCVRTSHPMIRAFTDRELKEFDALASARGGSGNWLIEADEWAYGQLWIGSSTDPSGAIAAYGGTVVDRDDLDGNPWMIVSREDRVIGVSLQSIGLPSGLTLWAPYEYRVPVDCPPGA
jgi:hypothetical protein